RPRARDAAGRGARGRADRQPRSGHRSARLRSDARAQRVARHEPRRRDARSGSRGPYGARARAQGRRAQAGLAAGRPTRGAARETGVQTVEEPTARSSSPGLPIVAAAVCAAVVVVHRLPALPGPGWLVPTAILGLVALARPATRWWIVVAAATIWTVWSAERRLDERLPGALTGRDFAVAGWVDGFPTGPPARRTFSFVVERADDPAVPRRLRLGWYDAPDSLEAGEAFALTARLRPPRGAMNPGGFDYEQWLLAEGHGAGGGGLPREGAGDGQG